MAGASFFKQQLVCFLSDVWAAQSKRLFDKTPKKQQTLGTQQREAGRCASLLTLFMLILDLLEGSSC